MAAERIAVVGSRDFRSLELVNKYIAELPPGTTVVSGAARGVDSTAAAAARARGLEVVEFPAQWRLYGKRAGFKRNALIVEQADRVVAFWNGASRGTAHTIELARRAGKPVEIVREDGR